MGLETATTIAGLNEANPLGTDAKSQGDDHLRLIKSVLKLDAMSISGTHAASTKATPVDADEIPLLDSAASYVRKRLLWSDLKSQAGFSNPTKMLFAQAAAPTGWTKDTTHDNKALRVVTGATGGSAGGTTAFTSVFASRTPAGSVSVTAAGSVNLSAGSGAVTLTAAQSGLPSHTHTAYLDAYAGFSTNAVNGARGGYDTSVPLTTLAATASASSSHSHSNPTYTFANSGSSGSFTGTAMDFAVQYVDLIICTKD